MKTMNDSGTLVSNCAEAVPLDLTYENTRRDLIATRTKHGDDTPKGHRCSNAIEQLKNLRGATGAQRENLLKAIELTMKQLAA
jgi:hypothetical protein